MYVCYVFMYVRPGRKSSGEPWNKIVSDWFQRKTIKVFLISAFKFERERVNMRCVWRVSGFFPRNVEVNTPGRFLISAIPKQRLHNLLGRITGFPNFQIKYLRYNQKLTKKKIWM